MNKLFKSGVVGRNMMLKRFDKNINNFYPNKSWWFFLPLLGSSYMEIYNLMGVFMRDNNMKDLNNHFFVLLEYQNSKEFSDYKKTITRKIFFEKEYKISNDKLMLVYNIPSMIQKDYDNFLKGKYSKISEEYKKRIIKFFNIKLNEPGWSTIIMILYKNKQYKEILEKKLNVVIPEENELASIINMDDETYTEDKFVL
jgi:hypothetical protein